jgi:hypothetical protein
MPESYTCAVNLHFFKRWTGNSQHLQFSRPVRAVSADHARIRSTGRTLLMRRTNLPPAIARVAVLMRATHNWRTWVREELPH